MSELTPAKRALLESLIRLCKGIVTALTEYLKACEKNTP